MTKPPAGSSRSKRRRLLFDIETNGLLDELETIHCIWAQDLDTQEVLDFAPGRIDLGVELLDEATFLAGHNIMHFDLPAIRKLYPTALAGFSWLTGTKQYLDTIIASRLIWPEIKHDDWEKLCVFKVHPDGRKELVATKRGFPRKAIGQHRLEAWGYRLGILKGDYTQWCKANGITEAWAVWRPEMHDYCGQDIAVNAKLLELIRKKDYSRRALALEHRFAETARNFPADHWAAPVMAQNFRRGRTLEMPIPNLPVDPRHAGVQTPAQAEGNVGLPSLPKLVTFVQDRYEMMLRDLKDPGKLNGEALPPVKGWETVSFNRQYTPRIWHGGKLSAHRANYGDDKMASFFAQAWLARQPPLVAAETLDTAAAAARPTGTAPPPPKPSEPLPPRAMGSADEGATRTAKEAKESLDRLASIERRLAGVAELLREREAKAAKPTAPTRSPDMPGTPEAVPRGALEQLFVERAKLAQLFGKTFWKRLRQHRAGVSDDLNRALSGEDLEALKAQLYEAVDDEVSKLDIDKIVEGLKVAEHGGMARSMQRAMIDENFSARMADKDGNLRTVRVDDLLENSAEHLFQMYSRNISGALAMARQG